MRTHIIDPFWSKRQELNQKEALIYQWEQYNRCGTLDNFRILAEGRTGKREGFFYTDSDLHKWADAASRSVGNIPNPQIEALLDEYIRIMEKAQETDGYLYTWNQLYFPQNRWTNIQIEHELYTAGHFIEAGISHKQASGKNDLFKLALKTADLVVRDFQKVTSLTAPGHQEIEIALIKLYRLTKNKEYLDCAERFLLARGHHKLFGLCLLKELISHIRKNKYIKKINQAQGTREMGFEFGENINEREPAFLLFRSFISFLTGSYHQQHKPIFKQIEPKGHSVRWTYMMIAATMLALEKEERDVSRFLEDSWDHLVTLFPGTKLVLS